MKIINTERAPGTSLDEQAKILNHKVTQVVESSAAMLVSFRFLKIYFAWASQVVQRDPQGFGCVRRLLDYKSLPSIIDYQARDPRERQGHVHKVRVWCWETRLFDYFFGFQYFLACFGWMGGWAKYVTDPGLR